MALERGMIPLGIKGIRALVHGDILHYKRVEDRPREDVSYALVEVQGNLNPLEVKVTLLTDYRGSWKSIDAGTEIKAAAFELFWDGRTPVNHNLEEVIHTIRPHLF